MASSPTYRQILRDGLWADNPALVGLLGLCPLLAASNNVVNGIALGFATTGVMMLSGGTVSLIRRVVPNDVRLPIYVLVIAAHVTLVESLMAAYLHELYRLLGFFVPLIVTNCAILGRAEAFASKHSFDRAVLDGFGTGLGFTAVLAVLGALREAVGTGALLDHADLLFGAAAKSWKLALFPAEDGCLLAVLPPGALIALGLLVAAKNLLNPGVKPTRRQPCADSAACCGSSEQ